MSRHRPGSSAQGKIAESEASHSTVKGAEVIHALWFTDVQPREVRRHLGLPPEHGPQAWVDRLAEELSGRADVKLEIASPGTQPYEPFTAGEVRYHGLLAPLESSRMRRVAGESTR